MYRYDSPSLFSTRNTSGVIGVATLNLKSDYSDLVTISTKSAIPTNFLNVFNLYNEIPIYLVFVQQPLYRQYLFPWASPREIVAV